MDAEQLAAIRERARLCAYEEWEDAGFNYRFQEGEVVANSATVSVAIVDSPYDLEHIAGMDPATTIALLDEIDRLNATIQRVRELHSSEGRTWADFDTCADCHKAYPCPTIRALTKALEGER